MSDPQDPYAHQDAARRRTGEWRPRGVLFALIERSGGQVDRQTYEQFVYAAGYKRLTDANCFLRGNPERVIVRDGDEYSLTPRGHYAAAAFDRIWLPKLRAGTVQWPTA